MSKIYTPEGWLNWEYLYPETKFILAVTGPRGTGKTYGLLKYILEHNLKFLYVRRLASQLEICSKEEGNPFKRVGLDTGIDIRCRKSKQATRFYIQEDDDTETTIGYGAALSTMATIRGVDFSDVQTIVFDEFIAMKNERPISDEFHAFENLLETVNRNRELAGAAPAKVIMLGNANKLANPYYLNWGFMKTALRMIRGGQMMYRTSDNTRIMVMLLNSPISERKRETALYKNASDDFMSMALDNAFEVDDTSIGTRKLTDCRHIVSVGSIGIYQLKSDGKHYVSETVDKSNFYPETDMHLRMFRTRYSGLKNLYLFGYILFENFDTELLFRGYLGLA